MTKLIFAFDKSARSYDEEGRLLIAKTNISKACVNPYWGWEIPGHEELGLDRDTVYQLFRDPKELEKSIDTFKIVQLLKEHVPVSADEPQQHLIAGSVGSDVSFDFPYLRGDMRIWDKEAIESIENGSIVELSSSYRYKPVMEQGVFDGQKYDGIMTEIKANHVALVKKGRAGPDVRAADGDPFHLTKEDDFMSVLKKKLAALFNKKFAKDEDITPEQVAKIVDTLLDVDESAVKGAAEAEEDNEKAKDETGLQEKVKALLLGKVEDTVIDELLALLTSLEGAAQDNNGYCPPGKAEDNKEMIDKKDMERAMDGLRADLLAASEAAREVRSVIGDVTSDSAVDIYRMALDHLGAEHKGVEDKAALRLLFRAASKPSKPETKPTPSFDSANDSFVKANPHLRLDRFRTI